MDPFRAGVVCFGTDESVPYGGGAFWNGWIRSVRGLVRFGTDESVPYGFGAFGMGNGYVETKYAGLELMVFVVVVIIILLFRTCFFGRMRYNISTRT